MSGNTYIRCILIASMVFIPGHASAMSASEGAASFAKDGLAFILSKSRIETPGSERFRAGMFENDAKFKSYLKSMEHRLALAGSEAIEITVVPTGEATVEELPEGAGWRVTVFAAEKTVGDKGHAEDVNGSICMKYVARVVTSTRNPDGYAFTNITGEYIPGSTGCRSTLQWPSKFAAL